MTFTSAAVVVGSLYLAVTTFLPGPQTFVELRSSNQKVNKLVDQGNFALRDETPERIRQSLDLFRKAVELEPEFVPAHYGIFNTQQQLGDNEGIRATAATLMKLAPDSAEAHLAADYVLWIDWRFREALDSARLTTKRRAFSKMAYARSYMAYGYMLIHSGDPGEALKQYRMAAQMSFDDSHIERHLGHPYFAQRQFEQALKHYDESVRLQPNHGLGHYWRGRALEELGDFKNAINAFETRTRVVGMETADSKAHYERLREAYQNGGPEGYWRRLLKNALARAKPDLYEIATLYARLGEKEKAFEYLQKACDQRAFTQSLLFDACWDRKDERFQAIVRRIGLLR